MLDRAAALKIKSFPFLGRAKGTVTRIKDKMFQSKQTGTRESKEINIEGRVQFDVMAVLMRDCARFARARTRVVSAASLSASC